MSGENYSGAYGKRPVWQWVVLYIVIGGIVYYAIYYFFLRNSNIYRTKQPAATTTSLTSLTATTSGPLISTQTDAKIGSYLADSTGAALYTNSSDSSGVSNCNDECVAAWPAYTATATTNLPAHVTVITRNDGSKQYAYKGMPLYRFSGDSSGQVTGNGLNGFHIAKP